MDKQRVLDEISKTFASPGWAYVKNVMQDEMMIAVSSIADNKPITEAHMNFIRGCLFAAKRCIEIPERLRQKLENDIAMEVATKQVPPQLPATAGKED